MYLENSIHTDATVAHVTLHHSSGSNSIFKLSEFQAFTEDNFYKKNSPNNSMRESETARFAR